MKPSKKILAALVATALSLTILAQAESKPRTEIQSRGASIDMLAMSSPGGTILSYLKAHSPKGNTTCYDHAVTTEAYTCLTQALQTSGLDKTLASQGTFTLFAPNDEAFRALAKTMSPSSFTNLLSSAEQLKPILGYHVLPETNTLNALNTGTAAGAITEKTLTGADVTLNFANSDQGSSNKVVSLGKDSHITAATIRTDNGTVLGIDHILTPPTESPTS